MFAVIKTGGKQYRVAPDDVLSIEKLEAEVGETVSFDQVLMLGGDGDPTVGSPMVDGASVAAEVVEQGRDRKIIVFKKKRRQNYRRKRGHRQHQTTVRITEILTGGAKPSQSKTAAAKQEKSEEAASEIVALFDRPDGEPDDLTRINGVGKTIVEKLHKLGITKFHQIAGFSAEDAEKVDEVLSFKGRIDREDWVGQAKALAEEAEATDSSDE